MKVRMALPPVSGGQVSLPLAKSVKVYGGSAWVSGRGVSKIGGKFVEVGGDTPLSGLASLLPGTRMTRLGRELAREDIATAMFNDSLRGFIPGSWEV